MTANFNSSYSGRDFNDLSSDDIRAAFKAPKTIPHPDNDDDEIATLDWAKLAEVAPEPKRFIIPKLAPAGEVTLFTGPGSAGKSLWAQQVATALAAGLPTLGLDMGRAPALYLTCEDDESQLHWRQHHICKALEVEMKSLAGRLFTASLRGRLDNAFELPAAGEPATTPRAYDRLEAVIRRTGAKLVFLDNLSHLFTGNENDRGDVTRFLNLLNRLAGETGAAIVLIGHTPKAFNQGYTRGNGHSGSTAWLNAVRSQFVIDHDLETDVRTLTVGKANYARNGTETRFVWVDWAFVLESDLSPDRRREMDDVIRANGENAAFLRCLEKATKDRRNVSHQPGSNYAPQIFGGMPEGKGYSRTAFKAAMERLLSLGTIELDADLWPGSNRHPKRGIRLKGACL